MWKTPVSALDLHRFFVNSALDLKKIRLDIVTVNKLKKQYQKSKASWYQRFSIAIPKVQHSYTAGKALLFCALSIESNAHS